MFICEVSYLQLTLTIVRVSGGIRSTKTTTPTSLFIKTKSLEVEQAKLETEWIEERFCLFHFYAARVKTCD